MPAEAIRDRVRALDRHEIEASLERLGHAHTGALLAASECRELVRLYPEDRRFRSRVDMERHRFGRGDYAYFAHPLPALVRELRTHLYRLVAPIANRWAEALHEKRHFPPSLKAYLARCHTAGQKRPTPLLLRYAADGYNCLHRDLYGDLVFPLQATIFLSRPAVDYQGGAFLLVEQRPRAQSRGDALLPRQGEMVIFPTSLRPVAGKRGTLRAGVRHGVARVTRGSRYTLGIIFHDAR